ncbi:MAG TPA: TldD/PmbA family protein [Spirochaetota bacterium]|nr:TldD/PmbA family protein [Spirochaetota bacterium]
MKGLNVDFLNSKCRWYDIIEVESRSTPVQFKNNKLYSIRESSSSGLGLRVNSGGKTGITYTNDTKRVDQLAERAVALAAYGDKEDFDLPCGDTEYQRPVRPQKKEFCVDSEIEKGKAVIATIEEKYPDAEINMSITSGNSSSVLRNSNGLVYSDDSFSYSASCSVSLVLDDGTRIETGTSKVAYNPEPLNGFSEEIVSIIDMSLKTAKLDSGRIPMILTPRALRSILSILMGGLSAEQIYRKVSPYENKIGNSIFNKAFTLFDDPLMKDSPYSYGCDDEGVASEKRALIENGTVNGFIADLKFASLLGVLPTGHSSRSYASKPGASFSNIEIAAGDIPYENIIKECSTAIVVNQFLGLGQSNTYKGDFSANVDLGFLVKNGEIVGRLKDCMVSGNAFDLFAGDIRVSSDVKEIPGARLPYMLFDGVNFTG